MPKDFNTIIKKCKNCGIKLKLNNTRDIKRKNFCSRSCNTKYTKPGNNVWNNIEIVKKIKNGMRKKHTITEKFLIAQRERGLKRRKPWSWYKENGSLIRFHQSQDWRDKAKEIYKRDGYKCCECGDKNKKLNCHHIVSVCCGGELFDNNNLITLCLRCHSRKHPELSPKLFK